MPNITSSAQSKDNRYVCKSCSRTFRRVEHLRRHETSHTGSRPHICPKCKATFFRGDVLVRHMRNVHKSMISGVRELRSSSHILLEQESTPPSIAAGTSAHIDVLSEHPNPQEYTSTFGAPSPPSPYNQRWVQLYHSPYNQCGAYGPSSMHPSAHAPPMAPPLSPQLGSVHHPSAVGNPHNVGPLQPFQQNTYGPFPTPRQIPHTVQNGSPIIAPPHSVLGQHNPSIQNLIAYGYGPYAPNVTGWTDSVPFYSPSSSSISSPTAADTSSASASSVTHPNSVKGDGSKRLAQPVDRRQRRRRSSSNKKRTRNDSFSTETTSSLSTESSSTSASSLVEPGRPLRKKPSIQSLYMEKERAQYTDFIPNCYASSGSDDFQPYPDLYNSESDSEMQRKSSDDSNGSHRSFYTFDAHLKSVLHVSYPPQESFQDLSFRPESGVRVESSSLKGSNSTGNKETSSMSNSSSDTGGSQAAKPQGVSTPSFGAGSAAVAAGIAAQQAAAASAATSLPLPLPRPALQLDTAGEQSYQSYQQPQPQQQQTTPVGTADPELASASVLKEDGVKGGQVSPKSRASEQPNEYKEHLDAHISGHFDQQQQELGIPDFSMEPVPQNGHFGSGQLKPLPLEPDVNHLSSELGSIVSAPSHGVNTSVNNSVSSSNSNEPNSGSSVSTLTSAVNLPQENAPGICSACREPFRTIEGTSTHGFSYRLIGNETDFSSMTDVLVGPERFSVPTVTQLDRYLSYYANFCHPSIPIIHQPSYDPKTSKPAMLFAICSLGASLLQEYKMARILHFNADRLLAQDWKKFLASGAKHMDMETWLYFMQTSIFIEWQAFAMASSSRVLSVTFAMRDLQSKLFAWMPDKRFSGDDEFVDQQKWIEEQMVVRSFANVLALEYVLRCCYNYDSRSHQILEVCQDIPLPCSELLWNTNFKAEVSWRQHYRYELINARNSQNPKTFGELLHGLQDNNISVALENSQKWHLPPMSALVFVSFTSMECEMRNLRLDCEHSILAGMRSLLHDLTPSVGQCAQTALMDEPELSGFLPLRSNPESQLAPPWELIRKQQHPLIALGSMVVESAQCVVVHGIESVNNAVRKFDTNKITRALLEVMVQNQNNELSETLSVVTIVIDYIRFGLILGPKGLLRFYMTYAMSFYRTFCVLLCHRPLSLFCSWLYACELKVRSGRAIGGSNRKVFDFVEKLCVDYGLGQINLLPPINQSDLLNPVPVKLSITAAAVQLLGKFCADMGESIPGQPLFRSLINVGLHLEKTPVVLTN